MPQSSTAIVGLTINLAERRAVLDPAECRAVLNLAERRAVLDLAECILEQSHDIVQNMSLCTSFTVSHSTCTQPTL